VEAAVAVVVVRSASAEALAVVYPVVPRLRAATA